MPIASINWNYLGQNTKFKMADNYDDGCSIYDKIW